jgi:hypothetical protein
MPRCCSLSLSKFSSSWLLEVQPWGAYLWLFAWLAMH